MLDIDTSKRNPEHTFKILIATDNHLGYNEKDPIRGEDSFNTFEEILQLAQEHAVDFILLGGDLFDANKPSQYCMQRTVNLIKKYSFGDKEINFIVSDDCTNGTIKHDNSSYIEETPSVNIYDPNQNVAIPIFSIHGNHDDPTGMKSVSSLDILSGMGLVNYIGRCDCLTSLEVNPVLFRKGGTKLAIYGIGHLADKRFARLHRERKISFNRFEEDNTFQLLMLHQNRADRGVLNFVPYSAIPEFMDLVIWGHEHDCYIEPNSLNQVYFSQPGSSVATSMSEGEARTKKVGILYVNKDDFYIEPIVLKTVRPMIFDKLLLDSPGSLDSEGISESYLEEYSEKKTLDKLNEMLETLEDKAKRRLERFGYKNDMLPLVRLVVQYVDQRQSFNHKKLSLMFVDKVANPQDIILQKRIILKSDTNDARERYDYNGVFDGDTAPKDALYYVQKGMEDAFNNSNICTASGMMVAFNRFVNYNDSNAFEDYFQYQKDKYMKQCEQLSQPGDSEDAILEKITQLMTNRNNVDESDEVNKLLTDPKREKKPVKEEDPSDINMTFDSNGVDDPSPVKKPTRGKGSRGGRGSRARGKKT